MDNNEIWANVCYIKNMIDIIGDSAHSSEERLNDTDNKGDYSIELMRADLYAIKKVINKIAVGVDWLLNQENLWINDENKLCKTTTNKEIISIDRL